MIRSIDLMERGHNTPQYRGSHNHAHAEDTGCHDPAVVLRHGPVSPGQLFILIKIRGQPIQKLGDQPQRMQSVKKLAAKELLLLLKVASTL